MRESMRLLPLLISGSTVNAKQRNCSHLQHEPTFRKYSQGNQDGILRGIFNLVGATTRSAVEFGFGYEANSGHSGEQLIEHNTGLNTRLLRKAGWNVVYFDALISDRAAGIQKVILTEDNIVSAFRAAGVPTEVDYVSIDVDSIDVWLLSALLKEYKPRVISVEYNQNFLSWMHITHVREWHPWTYRSVYGASAGAINHVAQANGYTAVNIMPSGLEIFFIRQDVLVAHCVPQSIARFEELANAARVGTRAHGTCDEKLDLPRLVDLHLEMRGYRKQAQLKAMGEVAVLNSLNPANPMCNMTSGTTRAHWTGARRVQPAA
jgi:hypothetical protein